MRLELTRRTDLALPALARSGALRKGGELAETPGTSAGFLAQVLAPLTRAGWVRSVHGPCGGYQATEAAPGVPVLQLIEAVEGPDRQIAACCASSPARHSCRVPCTTPGCRRLTRSSTVPR